MSQYDDYFAEHAGMLDLYMDEVEQQARSGVWETKDGEKVRVEDMTDSHLRNTIAFLKREDEVDILLPWINRLERELDRREAPTIEVEEVRHGKWVDVAKTEMFDKAGVKTWGIVYQCNQCGFIVNAVEGHIGQYNGCPSCRSKMEVEE